MSAALIKAIDDLLDFISAFREGFDLLEGEKQQRFAELDWAVWLSSRRLNLQTFPPTGPHSTVPAAYAVTRTHRTWSASGV